LLVARLLDGSLAGYFFAALVAILALALSDSIAGRELRLKLQGQLTDSERVVAYSRVVEGTIHNLRNHLSAAVGHLDEVPYTDLQADESRHVVVAAGALQDAVELLDQLQVGTGEPRPFTKVDMRQVVADVCLLVRSRADRKRVDLLATSNVDGKAIQSDPLLIKQILSNLVLNAIDAVATGGEVGIEVTYSPTDVHVSVIDNGPGVPDKYRNRLFEPHFTTKVDGNGIGLYVSYQLAHRLGGKLRYSGSPTGAIFTLTLPR
jgi:signal transduction histidine kinase